MQALFCMFEVLWLYFYSIRSCGKLHVCLDSFISTGPYFIGVDSFMTSVAVYAPVDQKFVIPQDGKSVRETWDSAIEEADREYSGKMHNICCQNCHHHTAKALRNMGIKSTLLWA